MNINKFLKQHFTVRMIDGVEVEKPKLKDHDCYPFCEKCTKFLESKEYSDYAAATEVIKLPNWMVFWDTLIGCAVRVGKSYKDVAILNNSFLLFMQQPPTIDKFVPWDGEVLEEPDAWLNYLNQSATESPDWNPIIVEECFRYELALDKVIFEGWRVIDNQQFITTIKDKSENILQFDNRAELVFLTTPKIKEVKTLDDLNRKCQLFMKVK
jgi:hypothetical protein